MQNPTFPSLDLQQGFLKGSPSFSKNTRETYRRVVGRFLAYVHAKQAKGTLEAGQIDLKTLEEYGHELSRRNLSVGSRRLEISALRSFLKWLASQPGCEAVPAGWQLRSVLPLPPAPPKPLSPATRADQSAVLLDLEQRVESLGKRNRAIFLLSALTGLRASEIGALRGSQILQTLGRGGWCARITGPRNRVRDVPLVDKVLSALAEYLADTGRRLGGFSGFVFLAEDAAAQSREDHGLSRWTITKVTKEAGRMVGLDGLTPRALRHAFGVGFLQQGGDLEQLRGLLGHESLASTQPYVRTAELADARETLERHVEHLERLATDEQRSAEPEQRSAEPEQRSAEPEASAEASE